MTVKYLPIVAEDFPFFLKWYGIEVFKEQCYLCRQPLGIGDYLDGLFPYDVQYNRCQFCKRLEAKQQKMELITL